jgi:hypothetical protein
LKADLHEGPGPADVIGNRVRGRKVEGDRFLAKGGAAGLCRQVKKIGMSRRCGSDHEGVNPRCEKGRRVFRAARVELFRERGGTIGIGICDRDAIHPRVRLESRGVKTPDPASAANTDVHGKASPSDTPFLARGSVPG